LEKHQEIEMPSRQPEINELRSHIPGADDLLIPRNIRNRLNSPSLYVRQKLRCAHIFQQTRKMVTEEGYSNFNVRKLATKCKLSPQTIYSMIGDRERILKSAVGQQLDALLEVSRNVDHYPNFILAMADTVWANGIKNAQYCSTVIDSQFRSKDRSPDCAHELMKSAIRETLAAMQNRNQLRSSTDIELVAERLQSVIAITGLNWADGLSDEGEMRRQLISGIGYLLIGTMRGTERNHVESWVDQVLRSDALYPVNKVQH
jgi:AcrR family transcriptional regulator